MDIVKYLTVSMILFLLGIWVIFLNRKNIIIMLVSIKQFFFKKKLLNRKVLSVLFLILVFFNSAALLILLGLDFFAMIFLVVYVGAIAVLFLFEFFDINEKKVYNTAIICILTLGLFLLFEVFLIVDNDLIRILLLKYSIVFKDLQNLRLHDLHHDLFFFMINILMFILWMGVRTLYHFHQDKNPIPEKIIPGSKIEIAWTVAPSIILICMSIPSFALLYTSDEVVDAGTAGLELANAGLDPAQAFVELDPTQADVVHAAQANVNPVRPFIFDSATINRLIVDLIVELRHPTQGNVGLHPAPPLAFDYSIINHLFAENVVQAAQANAGLDPAEGNIVQVAQANAGLDPAEAIVHPAQPFVDVDPTQVFVGFSPAQLFVGPAQQINLDALPIKTVPEFQEVIVKAAQKCVAKIMDTVNDCCKSAGNIEAAKAQIPQHLEEFDKASKKLEAYISLFKKFVIETPTLDDGELSSRHVMFLRDIARDQGYKIVTDFYLNNPQHFEELINFYFKHNK